LPVQAAVVSRRRLFGSLCLLVFGVNLARVVFAPLLSEFVRVFAASPGTVGLVATLAWLGSALPRLPTGWLLTHVPRHRVVVASGGLLATAALLTAGATSVTELGVGAFCMGCTGGAYFIAANPFVSELYPERVGRVLGIHGTASQLAAVVAAPLVTVLLVRASWRSVFVTIAGLAVVATVLVALAARRSDLPDAGTTDRDFVGAARREWRRILLGVVVLGSLGFVWQGLFNFYELYMVQKGLPSAAARNLLTVVFGAGVPAFFVSGRLADRLPHVPYLLAILGTFVVVVLAVTVASGLVPLLVLTAVLGYVVHSAYPAVDTFLLGTFPDETRASAYAMYSGSMMVVQATGSSVVGAAVDVGVRYDAVFTAMALGLGVVTLALGALAVRGRLPT
jgi:predicted MFS family arabinose efflux permease